MNTRITVHVSADTLEDARHTQGENFLPGICALLSDGCIVRIETKSNIVEFESPLQFTVWFKDYVGLLVALQQRLGAQGNKGKDWSSARSLEDALSAVNVSHEQIEKAEFLLAKYNN